MEFTKEMFLPQKQGLDLSNADELVAENEKVYFIETTFQFIKKHKGLRPGCMHIFLGQTGQGKTTLIRALVDQHIIAGINCGMYMTEETVDQIRTQIAYNGNIDKQKYKDHCFVMEEASILNKDDPKCGERYMDLVSAIRKFVKKNDIKVLVFDNLTTSEYYENHIETANALLANLKEMARELQIAMVMVFHSNADTFNNQIRIDPQQVRGSKASVNKTEYLYSFIRKSIVIPDNTWEGIDEFASEYAFVEVLKSRAHAKTGGVVYQLVYDQGFKTYAKDIELPWDKYIELVNGKKK